MRRGRGGKVTRRAPGGEAGQKREGRGQGTALDKSTSRVLAVTERLEA